MEICYLLTKYVQSRLLQNCRMRERVKKLILGNFFFCRHVFKKLSAEEASESVYIRERVKMILKVS